MATRYRTIEITREYIDTRQFVPTVFPFGGHSSASYNNNNNNDDDNYNDNNNTLIKVRRSPRTISQMRKLLVLKSSTKTVFSVMDQGSVTSVISYGRCM